MSREIDTIFPLSQLSVRQLEDLKHQIERSISEKRKSELYVTIKKLADEAGVDLKQLLDKNFESQGVKKVYMHPKNPSKTWNGKGRHPNWFKDLVREGYDPDQLVIKTDEDEKS